MGRGIVILLGELKLNNQEVTGLKESTDVKSKSKSRIH